MLIIRKISNEKKNMKGQRQVVKREDGLFALALHLNRSVEGVAEELLIIIEYRRVQAQEGKGICCSMREGR